MKKAWIALATTGVVAVSAAPASALPHRIALYNVRIGTGYNGTVQIFSDKTFLLAGRTKSTCTTQGSRNPDSVPDGTRTEVKTFTIAGHVTGRKLKADRDLQSPPSEGGGSSEVLARVSGQVSRDGRKVSGGYLFASTVSSPASPELGLPAYEEHCSTLGKPTAFAGTRAG